MTSGMCDDTDALAAIDEANRERDVAWARVERLEAALEESWLYEMVWTQDEGGYDVGGSDGWECASCFDSEGERPVFEKKEDVKHSPTCVLYRPTAPQGNTTTEHERK